MDPAIDFIFLTLSHELHEENVMSQERREIRENMSALDMSEIQFRNAFRISKDMFNSICDDLFPFLDEGSRSTRTSVETRILCVLRLLAKGSYQRDTGHDFKIGLCQSAVSKIFMPIASIMEQVLCPKFIKFPSTVEERQVIREGFYRKHRFPSVIGIIDGTHVQFSAPRKDEFLFVNRRGKHSLNVMIICDHNLKIISVDATHPGATHDSSIWNQSNDRLKMRSIYEEEKCWLLGDAGFPLEPWLIVPFNNTTSDSVEALYNTKHSKIRMTVERCIGVLKNRWRILLASRSLTYQPLQYIQIINVCVALHNMCREFNLPDEEFDDLVEFDDTVSEPEENNISAHSSRQILRQQGEHNRARIMNIIS